LGVCATAAHISYFYFYMVVKFCIADEDWKAFDFGDAFPIWSYIYNVDLEFFVNFKWVIYTFAASIFGISWGSFFRAKNASSSL
jgi:hypothetical protein